MKKYIRMLAGLLLCSLLFSGCGSAEVPEVIDTTTIIIDKEGVITSYLVDEFHKDYYSVSELTDMAVEDAAAYNAEHQNDETIPLRVEKVELLAGGDKVLVQHIYDEDETYAEYNESVFFYGTVEDAIKEGYDLSALLTSVKDGTPLTTEDLMKKPEKSYVLITDAKAVVYCPRKITHVGDGVVYSDNGSVDTTKVDGVVVVLMR